jgi:hypothetical protein
MLPQRLSAVEYEAGEVVRKVQHGGWISYAGREWRLSKAFHGQPVALRQSEKEAELAVYFCKQKIAVLDLREGTVRPSRG